jgi:hypothetical protein
MVQKKSVLLDRKRLPMAVRHVPSECEARLFHDLDLKSKLITRSLYGVIHYDLKSSEGASFEVAEEFHRPFRYVPHVQLTLRTTIKDRFAVQMELGDVCEKRFVVALLNISGQDVSGDVFWKAEVPLIL